MHKEPPSPYSPVHIWPLAEQVELPGGKVCLYNACAGPGQGEWGRGHSTSGGSKHLRASTQIFFKFVHQRNQDFKYQSIPKQEISTWEREICFFSFFPPFLGCLRDFPG